MFKVFDYIYYRWYNIVTHKDVHRDIYASSIVASYQMLTFINLILLASILFGFKRPDKIYIILLAVILIVINWYRYERGFDISKLEERWGNEPEDKKRIRFILLIAYLVVTFTVPWIYGFATN
ncbi:hypothetical protein C900_00216 [Fulvivirga imtechensis AK7]|uniref:Uncharacterized protein n=2 Tax=Fulvivirga TaxID=396811 RepID=L8JIE4_9BACT|nr:hypothetical protein C900_00216 [Fulvivirga imtechensis AK7]